MFYLKRILLSLILVTSLAQAPKANAAYLMFKSGGNLWNIIGAAVVTGVALQVAAINNIKKYYYINSPQFRLRVAIVPFQLFLDGDSEAGINHIQSVIMSKYKFLDNDTAEKLASEIESKIESDDQESIIIDVDFTKDALELGDYTDAQREEVLAGLTK